MTPETPDFTTVRRFAVVTVYAREGALGAGATRQATNGDWVRFSDYESLRLAHEQVTHENARLTAIQGSLERQSKYLARLVDSASDELSARDKRANKAEADLAALRAAVREQRKVIHGLAEAHQKGHYPPNLAEQIFDACDALHHASDPDPEYGF